MDESKCFRGTHGDVKPVEVPRRSGLGALGCLRAGYYGTEIEAWAGLLAAWKEAVGVAEGEEARAWQEYVHAKKDKASANQRQAQAGQNFEAWRKAQAAAKARAMAEQVAV